MSQPESAFDVQLQNLLKVVDKNRDERCTAILDNAQQQARQIVRNAYRQARTNLHKQVLDTRHRAQRKLSSAQAQGQTRLRLHKQRTDDQLLARAWEPLIAQLNSRWQLTESRGHWVDALIRQASATLISTPWHIEHPADWSEAERSGLKNRLRDTVGAEPVYIAEPTISAGLRICAGQACVDGTIEGLLGSRTHIEGMLLAKLNECRNKASDKQPGHGDD